MTQKKPADERVSKITPFGLRLSPSLRKSLDAVAAAEHRSLNSQIIVLLEEALEAREKADG